MKFGPRAIALCIIAGALGLAAGWLRLAGRFSDNAMIDEEAKSFGFSNPRDYTDFFALDRHDSVATMTDDQLRLLQRVSKDVPRFRALVLDIASRETNEQDATKTVTYLQAALTDPNDADAVDTLKNRWKTRGFVKACEMLGDAKHEK